MQQEHIPKATLLAMAVPSDRALDGVDHLNLALDLINVIGVALRASDFHIEQTVTSMADLSSVAAELLVTAKIQFASVGSVAFPTVANSAPGLGPVGPAQTRGTDLMALFSEWKKVRYTDISNMPEHLVEANNERYADLCDAISCISIENEKLFAIQYHVATDAGDRLPCCAFQLRMQGLLAPSEVSPC